MVTPINAQPDARANSAAASGASNGRPNNSTGTPPLRRRPVKRYRQGRPRLKPFDDLHKGKTVLADDQGLNPATPPQRDAKVGQAIIGFGLGEDRQRDAELGQQQTAMLPIAEVERDEQDAAARVRGRRG